MNNNENIHAKAVKCNNWLDDCNDFFWGLLFTLGEVPKKRLNSIAMTMVVFASLLQCYSMECTVGVGCCLFLLLCSIFCTVITWPKL